MLRSDVLVAEALGFLGAIGQHALAFVTQGEIHRRGHLLPDGGVRFNLLADRFDCGVRAQESIREGFVFPEQSQKQVLRFDVRAAELAGLVAGEEDYPARLFGITFKHIPCCDYWMRLSVAELRDPSRRRAPPSPA